MRDTRQSSWAPSAKAWVFSLALAAALCSAACKGGDKEKDAAAHSEAPSAARHDDSPASSGPASEGTQNTALKFDPRALLEERQSALLHKAVWGTGPDGECAQIPLADPRFKTLYLSVTFYVTSADVAKAFEKNSLRFTALSAQIEKVFRTKTSAELAGPEAMHARKEELAAAVNQFFGATVVRSVYFTQYSLEL